MGNISTRRAFLANAARATAGATVLGLPQTAFACLYDVDGMPPTDDRDKFITWMQAVRGEQPVFLVQRWNRFVELRKTQELPDVRNARAFLMTPREEFVLKRDVGLAYEARYLDIGFGSTISGPQIVARMTGALDVKECDKVLEIGTGAGYQSAYLAALTGNVFTVELVKELAERTHMLYASLIDRGYNEYKSVSIRHADGYFGWQEAAPFDKIIVTCGIDHIPPALLDQLTPEGTMVIPVGSANAQHVLKVQKKRMQGRDRLVRSDIFHGRMVRFVPLKRSSDEANTGDGV